MLASLKNVQSFNAASEGAFLNWLAKVVENRIRDHLDYFRAEKRDHRLEKPLAGPRSAESSLPLDIPERSRVPTTSQVLILSEDLARQTDSDYYFKPVELVKFILKRRPGGQFPPSL